MEIERINENTVKFYISYIDIEERGFDREEIWYNRERSEELFWEMMDEVHEEEDFSVEGPLWIQVQALDKGLEILVTKAQVSRDGQRFELPISEEKLKGLPIDDQLEELLDQHFQMKQQDEEESLEFMFVFHDFEDLLSLTSRPGLDELITKLYSYKNRYYLFVMFPENDVALSEDDHEILDDQEEAEPFFTDESIDNVLSIILEYGYETSLTYHILEEYGKIIIEENVFNTLRHYFK
ncbi:adapter protein MecA 1/2 [Oikeobacillus pervagus]|uniref:Adapter protein MecA n=1 Tax=Oikeobacillus pervagus TaxID=1325931 RepID=A0AAJ1WJN1_9BACI|nr:adaptor protein MecA [Oikeobacillus pervagus]MDQ0215658.1 adapter protein MecA 1/2 [Oikeobacillus pervagus]